LKGVFSTTISGGKERGGTLSGEKRKLFLSKKKMSRPQGFRPQQNTTRKKRLLNPEGESKIGRFSQRGEKPCIELKRKEKTRILERGITLSSGASPKRKRTTDGPGGKKKPR